MNCERPQVNIFWEIFPPYENEEFPTFNQWVCFGPIFYKEGSISLTPIEGGTILKNMAPKTMEPFKFEAPELSVPGVYREALLHACKHYRERVDDKILEEFPDVAAEIGEKTSDEDGSGEQAIACGKPFRVNGQTMVVIHVPTPSQIANRRKPIRELLTAFYEDCVVHGHTQTRVVATAHQAKNHVAAVYEYVQKLRQLGIDIKVTTETKPYDAARSTVCVFVVQ